MKKNIIFISLIISGINFAFCQVDTFELNKARMGMRNFNYITGPYNGPEDDTTGMTIGPIPGNGTFSNNRSMSITDFQDIQVYPSSFQETEPHLTINKNHPNNIILSSNFLKWLGTCNPCTCPTCTTYTVGQSIFWNENYNNNTPAWWRSLTLPNATNEGNDPSTGIDAMGNYYVSGIEHQAQSILFESTTQPPYANAISWPNQTWAWTPSTSTSIDKDMIAVDNLPQDPNSSVVSVNWIYAVWSNYALSPNPVQFNYSSVGPVPSFSGTIDLNNRFGSGSNVQTGPYHEVYVCWADFGEFYNAFPPGFMPCNASSLWPPCYPPRKIGFARGTPVNNGVNFIPAAYPIDLTSAGSISNGGIQFNNEGLPPLNNTRANDFPSMAVDKSCGPYRGRIYIAYAANDINFPNPDGTNFKSRVFLQYSDDYGLSFQACNTNGVIDDNGYQNWMPWVSVDPATGNVYVAYYKTTALTPNYTTCVFLAYSDDYGSSFSQIQVSGQCFTPRPLPEPPFAGGGYNGDYIACDAYAGNIYVAWPQNLNPPTNQFPKNNIFCSRLVASTPALIRSGTGIDLTLNGIVDIAVPPNSPDNVTYEAYNNITVAADQQKFVISSGGTATFHAGNSIHVLPGSFAGNDFGALNGSLTHLYVSGVDPSCTTPFRIGNFKQEINKNSENVNNILNAYPNPFQNNFDLKYSVEKDENESISVFDSYGHKIINVITNQWIKSGVYNVKIDMYENLSGVYYLILQSDRNMFVKKIIKL